MAEPDRDMKMEWKGRAAFAQMAEALMLPTNVIVAVVGNGTEPTVLYSPGLLADFDPADPEQMRVFVAPLAMDATGILRVVDEPVELPEFWKHLGLSDLE